MAIDTPAKLAIIGAGPIGLEAALYARFLGYEVEVLERGEFCENLRRSAAEPLAGPFGEHCSTLALAALSAQDSSWKPPAIDAILTCGEWIERYLRPLAESDLVTDSIREQTAVVGLRRGDSASQSNQFGEDDAEITSPPFLLVIRDSSGSESTIEADGVIDCSGIVEASTTEPAGGAWLSDLRIDFDTATGAPRGMADWLRGTRPAEGTPVWQPFITSEPDFYILGAKSYASAAPFRFKQGLIQIRDLFTLVHDRPDLDIYQRMARGGLA